MGIRIGTVYRSKRYIKIPYGEIQIGRLTGSISLWFRGKVYWIRRPR